MGSKYRLTLEEVDENQDGNEVVRTLAEVLGGREIVLGVLPMLGTALGVVAPAPVDELRPETNGYAPFPAAPAPTTEGTEPAKRTRRTKAQIAADEAAAAAAKAQQEAGAALAAQANGLAQVPAEDATVAPMPASVTPGPANAVGPPPGYNPFGA